MAEPKSSRSTEPSPVDGLLSTVAAFLAARQNLNPSFSRLCVALSGGRDSVVLLHALSGLVASGQLPLSLSAVHVHHGLSPHADAWAAFCADLCRDCGVPLNIVRIDVPRHSGDGLEAAARGQRHAVFSECSADWLALAHHRDDQAETVLLNLLRGAGIAGAAGMLAERPQRRGPSLIRPLLEVPRAMIEAYASAQGLRWIEDESNGDVHFRRNFLRHAVMPKLADQFTGASKSLARAASHFAEGAALLDDLAAMDRAALATSSGRVAVDGFNRLTPARARNLLRFEWVKAGFRAPDTRWIDEALRQLATTNALSETCLTTPEGALHAYRGEMYFSPNVSNTPSLRSEPMLWQGEAEWPWAGGRVRLMPVIGTGLRRKLLDEGPVTVTHRQGGERLQLDRKRPRRSLRKLLQEAAVPPWERERLPFLWSAGRLLWVGGIGADAAFLCAPDEEGVLPIWESSKSGAPD